MQNEWDLNIYFLEEWDDESQTTVNQTTLRINPVLWTMKDGISDVTYTNWYIETTFAETRYIRSQYSEETFGFDWTDSLDNFLEVAPPRLKSLLLTLPDPETMDAKKALSLVG